MKFWEISKFNCYKRSSCSHNNNLFQVHLKDSEKDWMKLNQLDDCKVKILENQGEFDILTKDSEWNIDKRALKRSNK